MTPLYVKKKKLFSVPKHLPLKWILSMPHGHIWHRLFFVPVTVKGKIKIELVLLRQFSKMNLRGHWKSVTYARLSLDGIWPFNARNLRYLSYTSPKITHDSQPLRTNISFLVSQYSLVTFAFIISWLFLFSGNLVLPKSVSAKLQFLRPQMKALCFLQPWYWWSFDITNRD